MRLRMAALVSLAAAAWAGDWTDYRGPRRDGTSPEKNLPSQWSPAGENLAWRAPYGGRSTPVIHGDRLYLFNAAGEGATMQERLVALHAETGRLLWEHRFNVYQSDVPWHRIAWSAPAVDAATGHVYVFGVGGVLKSLTRDGKQLWERSLGEEFGLVTTHGGRTVSPAIEGDQVLLSGVTTGWGDQSRAGQRFFAFDKKTGETLWVSSPGGRPFDTVYSPPILADVKGLRLLLSGGSDGTIHALKPLTGESVWKYVISKRGINTGVVLNGATAFVSHSEENLDSSEMGLLAAVDAGARGEIGKEQIKWSLKGFQGGFSSPLIDGDRIYQIDNGANLFAFDVVTGKQVWTHNLGTVQKASPVLADGKLYVGEENGRFWILRPRATGCDVLDQDQLGTAATPELIRASVAVSNGRIFLVTSEATYGIGKKSVSPAPAAPAAAPAPADSAVAHVLVTPTELILAPGESVQFHARLHDAQGRFLREDQAAWSLEQLRGGLAAGRYTAPAEAAAQVGLVKAAVGGVTGAARVRVIPRLPLADDFDAMAAGPPPRHWINTTGKFVVRETSDGKVLVKLADNPFTKRARAFFGHTGEHDYTVQADVRSTERRRQMGDAGVIAQRYALVLFGNHQRLELQPWQPETTRTVTASFPWKPETWYRMKLRVENLADGKVLARGKAWPAAEAEPAAWSIERVDPIGNRVGTPGIYADAPVEVFFDNIKVNPNR